MISSLPRSKSSSRQITSLQPSMDFTRQFCPLPSLPVPETIVKQVFPFPLTLLIPVIFENMPSQRSGWQNARQPRKKQMADAIICLFIEFIPPQEGIKTPYRFNNRTQTKKCSLRKKKSFVHFKYRSPFQVFMIFTDYFFLRNASLNPNALNFLRTEAYSSSLSGPTMTLYAPFPFGTRFKGYFEYLLTVFSMFSTFP